MKPFVAIYSTFLQRAYDQVIHDVAIQNLPVRFAIDRAGLVGADGPTHAGSFDIAYLAIIPNIVIMAPSDENELARAVHTAYLINDRPSAFRYPRGEGPGTALDAKPKPFVIGKAKMVQKGSEIAILSCGTVLKEVLESQNMIQDLKMTIVDARFAKPIDEALIKKLAKTHKAIIIVEEGSIGGFAAQVVDFLENNALLDNGLIVRSIKLPDTFIEQGDHKQQHLESGLNSKNITKVIRNLLKLV